MAYYRLYVIDRGHFVRCHDFHAADDPEAVDKAAAFAGPQPMELWCRSRKVRSFEGVREARSPAPQDSLSPAGRG
jgi:hypothetical protein